MYTQLCSVGCFVCGSGGIQPAYHIHQTQGTQSPAPWLANIFYAVELPLPLIYLPLFSPRQTFTWYSIWWMPLPASALLKAGHLFVCPSSMILDSSMLTCHTCPTIHQPASCWFQLTKKSSLDYKSASKRYLRLTMWMYVCVQLLSAQSQPPTFWIWMLNLWYYFMTAKANPGC